MTGIVKSFYARRGFGFITPLIGKPDETPDVFFHVSAIRGGGAIPKGAEVKFDLVRAERGAQAANVELVTVGANRLQRERRNGDRHSEVV